jgi:predicted DNA-binding ribbon-helix-helix protein
MVSTLKKLDAQLQEQALEVANLRSALDVQFKRIAQMQAELDILAMARARRKPISALSHQMPARNNNGNGKGY